MAQAFLDRNGRFRNEEWWSYGESNPTQRSCKDHLSPTTSPVSGAQGGIEPPTRAPSTRRSTAECGARAPNWCGRRESNPNLESGALALCLRAATAWWGMGQVERLAAEGRRLQRRDGTARPYLHYPNWLQAAEFEPRAERVMARRSRRDGAVGNGRADPARQHPPRYGRPGLAPAVGEPRRATNDGFDGDAWHIPTWRRPSLALTFPDWVLIDTFSGRLADMALKPPPVTRRSRRRTESRALVGTLFQANEVRRVAWPLAPPPCIQLPCPAHQVTNHSQTP